MQRATTAASEPGHHHELGACIDGTVRLGDGQHRAGADQQVGQLGTHQLDGLDAGRGPERDLGARQTRVTQRGAQRWSVLGARRWPPPARRRTRGYVTNVQRPAPAPAPCAGTRCICSVECMPPVIRCFDDTGARQPRASGRFSTIRVECYRARRDRVTLRPASATIEVPG